MCATAEPRSLACTTVAWPRMPVTSGGHPGPPMTTVSGQSRPSTRSHKRLGRQPAQRRPDEDGRRPGPVERLLQGPHRHPGTEQQAGHAVPGQLGLDREQGQVVLLVVGAAEEHGSAGDAEPVRPHDSSQLALEQLAREVLRLDAEGALAPALADRPERRGEDPRPRVGEVEAAQRLAVEMHETGGVELAGGGEDRVDGALVGGGLVVRERGGTDGAEDAPMSAPASSAGPDPPPEPEPPGHLLRRHRRDVLGGRLGGDAGCGEAGHELHSLQVDRAVAAVVAARAMRRAEAVAALPRAQGGGRDAEAVGNRAHGPAEHGHRSEVCVGGVRSVLAVPFALPVARSTHVVSHRSSPLLPSPTGILGRHDCATRFSAGTSHHKLVQASCATAPLLRKFSCTRSLHNFSAGSTAPDHVEEAMTITRLPRPVYSSYEWQEQGLLPRQGRRAVLHRRPRDGPGPAP